MKRRSHRCGHPEPGQLRRQPAGDRAFLESSLVSAGIPTETDSCQKGPVRRHSRRICNLFRGCGNYKSGMEVRTAMHCNSGDAPAPDRLLCLYRE